MARNKKKHLTPSMQHFSSFCFTSLLNGRQLVAGWPGKQAKRKQLQHVLALCKIDAIYSIRIESRSKCLLKPEKNDAKQKRQKVLVPLFRRNVKRKGIEKQEHHFYKHRFAMVCWLQTVKDCANDSSLVSPRQKRDNITR